MWATAGPDTFDCSGLTHWVAGQVWGEDVPFELRSSHHQFNVWGQAVEHPQPGDLVFFDVGQGEVMGNLAGHVGFLAENTSQGWMFIHAANETLGVIESHFDTDYWQERYIGARRIFDLAPEPVKAIWPPRPIPEPRLRKTLPQVYELSSWHPQTPNQWNGGDFPVSWGDVYYWREELEGASRAAEVDVRALATVAMMETQGVHWRDGEVLTVWDDFPEDGPAVGVMQLKPQLWGKLAPELDPAFPAQNILLAAKIIRHHLEENGGDLDAAMRKWFPARDPNGSTPDSYMATFWGLMGELGYGR